MESKKELIRSTIHDLIRLSIQLSLTELGWLAFKSHEEFHGKDMPEVVKRLSAFSISQVATLSVLLETISGIMEKRLNKRLKK